MAEAAGASLSFVVQKLGDLLIQKVNFLQGVEGKVSWLKDELQMMQSFLKDASQKQADDGRVRRWISDIRNLAQDAEDVIEFFALKVDAPQHSRGLLGKCVCFPRHVNYLNNFGQEIESIRNRLSDINTRLHTYNIQSLGNQSLPSWKKVEVERRRQVFPWHTDKHVVGLEKDIDTLLQRAIFNEKSCLSVACIVGMGGIGKSTLAKKVYNHEKVAGQFECLVWITVSRDFIPKDLMKAIAKQLWERDEDETRMREIMKEASEQELMQMVNQRLRGKRYLIVVDDVWEQQHWKYLAKVFPDDQDKASRLLITSRIKNIISRDAEYVHELKGLDSEKSWELFLKSAVNDGNCPPNLEGIGKEILEKCDGLPLAIILVGGLLFEQGKAVSGWEHVRNGIRSHSLTSKDSVSAILELSYHDLPPHLQSCFLCLSFFREDNPINAYMLGKIWVAEGIVPYEEEKTMEQTAQNYLDELINRSLVQALSLSTDGQVKSCRIHDLLLDLCVTKAKEEINFYIQREEGSAKDLFKTRHVSIYSNIEKCKTLQHPNLHVRTLFLHNLNHNNYDKDVSGTDNVLKSFEGLRVLYLSRLGLKEVPKSVGRMIGLRYLNLSFNKIHKLPKSLSRLRNLQTLNILGNGQVIVPNVIWKLDNLRHLFMPFTIICKEPLKLDTLKHLQTINGISTKNMVVEHLKELINLRKLVVDLTTKEDINKLFTSLSALTNLDVLALKWTHGHVSLDGICQLKHITTLNIDGPLEKLPAHFPQSLRGLWLSKTKLNKDQMRVLEKLPELLYLSMHKTSYADEDMIIRENGFPNLRFFSLKSLRVPTKMHIGNNALLKLEELEIDSCLDLEFLPQDEELRLMRNLQTLRIRCTSNENACKLNSETYSHVISKIPSVQVTGY